MLAVKKASWANRLGVKGGLAVGPENRLGQLRLDARSSAAGGGLRACLPAGGLEDFESMGVPILEVILSNLMVTGRNLRSLAACCNRHWVAVEATDRDRMWVVMAAVSVVRTP